MKFEIAKKWLLIGILFIGNLALSSEYFVSEVAGAGIDADLKVSVRELAKSAVSEAGGDVATSPRESDYILRTQLIRLGNSYVVTVSRWQNGKRQYSTKAKASNVEELDRVMTRTVRAAMQSKRVRKDTRVGEMTQREQKELQNRRDTLNLQYFSFGPSSFQNLETEDLGIHVAWGYIWEVNLHAAVRFTVEGGIDATDDTASLLAATLGASYYFTTSDVSPYVFGDFGYGAAASTDVNEDTVGFSLGGGVGVIFFRTSRTQMDLSVRYLAIMDENEKGTPALGAVRLGILF